MIEKKLVIYYQYINIICLQNSSSDFSMDLEVDKQNIHILLHTTLIKKKGTSWGRLKNLYNYVNFDTMIKQHKGTARKRKSESPSLSGEKVQIHVVSTSKLIFQSHQYRTPFS